MCPGLTTEPPITFSQPAMTLGHLLPKLGEAAGVKMEADKSIKNEVVLVQVKDVAVKDLMAKVAKAACGEWEEQDGKQVLKLNRDQDRAERTADLTSRREQLQQRLSVHAEMLGLGSSSKRLAHYGDGDQQAYKILALAPVDRIVLLESDETIAFGYPFSGNQIALPASCLGIANEMLSKSPNKLPGNLSKVLIKVSRLGDQIRYEVCLLRNDGIALARCSASLDPVPEFPENLTPAPPRTAKFTLTNPSAAVSLPEKQRKAIQKIGLFSLRGQSMAWVSIGIGDNMTTAYIDSSFNPKEFDKLSNEQEDSLRKPDEVDPLSIGLGDALSNLGATQNVNLIACLPDSAECPACLDLREQSFTAAKLLEQASAKWGLDADQDGHWLTIRPALPSEARAKRLDREALRELIDHCIGQSPPPLDLLSRYCATQPLVGHNESFESVWLRMNCSEIAKKLYQHVPERCMYRFWGLLSASQRDRIRNGKSIAMGSLLPEQRTLLYRAMPMMHCSLDNPSAPKTDQAQSYIDDSSEVLPPLERIRADLKGAYATRETLLGISENGEKAVFDFQTIEDIAMALVREMSNPDAMTVAAPRIRYPYYQPGKRTAIKLSVNVLNGPERYKSIVYSHMLYDDSCPAGFAPMSSGDLPEPLKKWIERQLKHLQELEQRAGPDNPLEKKI